MVLHMVGQKQRLTLRHRGMLREAAEVFEATSKALHAMVEAAAAADEEADAILLQQRRPDWLQFHRRGARQMSPRFVAWLLVSTMTNVRAARLAFARDTPAAFFFRRDRLADARDARLRALHAEAMAFGTLNMKETVAVFREACEGP